MFRTQQEDQSSTLKKFAVGALLSAAVGYVAGVLTAPRSGRETRADIRSRAQETYANTERQLKKLHTELNDVINEVSDRIASFKNQKEVSDALDKGRDAKQKAREVLSTLHDGEADDKDLKQAIAEATKAIEHLRDFLRK